MKLLFKIGLILLVIFSVFFMIAQYFSLFGEEGLGSFFQNIYDERGSTVIGSVLAGLLALDLFLPLPSSMLMTASGYYCGTMMGVCFSFLGSMISATLGFYLCRLWGAKGYRHAAGEEEPEVQRLFDSYGPLIILISRGIPMLTEIISCLAGLSRMRFIPFMMYSVSGTLPICFIYASAGAASSDSITLAVVVALGLPALGLILWKCYLRFYRV